VSLLAITSNGKIGLGLVALVFIGFALVSSFVLPRRNPDFPGERLGLYVAVATLLFLGMLAAVVVFAREGEEEEAGGEQPALTETGAGTETGAETETSGETTTEGETETETTGGSAGGGDAAAGESVFASAGCGGCHTLAAAGSAGNVGPNLDEAKPSMDKVVERVTGGKGVMPSFKDQLSAKQIQDVAAYVFQSTHG
jgi:mono/diheme cytochrome c family protein